MRVEDLMDEVNDERITPAQLGYKVMARVGQPGRYEMVEVEMIEMDSENEYMILILEKY